ncbi:hypothetical protein GCM10023216_02910 [Isoptericola chiayiensis]|uniref:DUF4349 domain-containing protein n=1 Tax=Isoptericola chiayiensis TaxID=579446 RepID=A0ABP8XYN9_9MICO|nr:DUF4349 domain-containing protein [Isoptericola chiayiensis]NOW01108.1 hypothetical protein [Isoptericola chiayiensis]
MPHRSLPRRAAAAVTALTLALGLAACTGSGAGDAADVGTADTAVSDEAGGAASAIAEEAGADGAAGDETVVDREIVVTGFVELTSPDPAASADELVRMVEQAGGRVEQLTEEPTTPDRPGSASAIFRLPAERTTSAVEAFGDVAAVERVELSEDDVTSRGQNLDARISALTTSTDRLTELMGSAGSTEDLLEVERELAQRQAELDSLTAQREALSDQVAMSTIHVSITARTAPVTAPSSGFVDGLATGWSALTATVGTVVLALGVLLPWLAIAAAGYVAYRLVRRRRTEQAPPAGGPGEGGGTDDDGTPDSSPDPAPHDPEREPQLVR